jgi:hypothetical protein
MTTFARRVIGAIRLDPAVYEEVEATRAATPQAVAIVLLASAAGGIGLLDLQAPNLAAVVMHTAGALIGWVAWAALTYSIGTGVLPEPQTRADTGELLRTLAFAGAPGLLRIFGLVPRLGPAIYVVASMWMLVAMVVAVRQALDYRSTGRAIAVCLAGWALSLAIAALLGNLFARSVS